MMNRAAFLALALACIALAAPVRAAPAFEPTRFSVDVRGTGPDVILIPGLASSRAVFDDTVRGLAPSHRLHLVQVAGFAGQSAGPNASGPVIAPLVEELHAYIAAHGLKRPAVIGHSMGGLAGLMLTGAHPQDVGRLMVVDALPSYSALFGPQVTAASAEPFAVQARDQITGMTAEAFAASEAQAVARLSNTEPGRKTVLGWAVGSDRAVVARATYDDMTTDMRGALADIQAPVTVVYAWDAAMGPVGQVDGLYQSNYAALPNKRLARIDGSFHFIPLDQPDLFAAEVAKFLARP